MAVDEALWNALASLGVGGETLREAACFDPPDNWLGHVPFVFWLIKTLQPEVVVEVSAESRVSHFASCQAIDEERLATRAYAFGGWTAGPRDHSWIQDLDARYGRFSSLPGGDVEQSRAGLVGQRIDLLILRGNAALSDIEFEGWRPLLSARAVLLLDQINLLQAGPVRASWAKLAGAQPHFEFPHALGLGVAGLGNELPDRLRALFALSSDPEASEWVRRFFATRGAAGECRGALAAERHRGRLSMLDHEAHISAIQARYRNRLKESHHHLSTWLGQSLQQYDHWMRGEIHRSRVDAAQTVDRMARELAQVAGERDAARNQIGSMVQSTSWRITAPLRRVRGHAETNQPAPADTTASQPEDVPETVISSPPDLPLPHDPAGNLPDLFVLREHRATSRIAVVLHVQHPENVEVVLGALAAIAEPFDLFVLLVEEVSEHLRPLIRHRFASAQVFDFPDCGGDVLPFLAIAGTGALFEYELVCKLETGPSLSEGAGACAIPGDRAQTAALVGAFANDPDLGLVVANESTIAVEECWLRSPAHLRPWLALLGLSPDRPPPSDLISGRVFWLRPWVLRDLVSLRLEPGDFKADPALVDAVTSLFGAVCHAAGLKVQTASAALAQPIPALEASAPPVIAFYLPQFHPTPENDRWWGTGFTEWTNVTSAKPLFPGHRQPRLPGELGFVDLRLAEIREAQAALAQAYGITAFCYYYYWFGRGRRLLHRPLDEVRTTGRPDFPFLICWANEPWSRRWDGAAEDVLVAQDYEAGWEQAFADDAAPVLQDPRYFRTRDGRPLLLVYRIMHIPQPAESLTRLRQHLLDLGVGPVHIACGRFSLIGDAPVLDDPTHVGCDSYFEFPPHGLPTAAVDQPPGSTGQIFDYPATVDRTVERLGSVVDDRLIHHGVMAGWDNTARRGASSHVFRGATPAHFRRWLRAVVRHEQARTNDVEKLIFINAWNEWAEGTYLEPDRDFGRGWLEAVRSALGRQ